MLLFDARYLAQPRSGIPRYALNVLRALRDAEYPVPTRVLIPPGYAVPGDLAGHTSFDFVSDPDAPRSPRDQLRWPGRLRRFGATALHCPDAFGPLRTRVPVALTLHDVIPLLCRGQLARSRKQRMLPLWRGWLKQQCQTARTVVTVSQRSADDIAAQLGVDRNKLEVVPNAVPAWPPGEGESSDTQRLEALGIRRPFVLHVGRFDPYKNVPGLIEAFARLCEDPARREQLVLAGAPDPRYPQARQRASDPPLKGRVVFTGEINDETLRALYRRASLLVMPSLYEGFGLPTVEAMRAGVPVVASNRGALPEVVGGAALLVDAKHPAALGAAMAHVLDHPHVSAALVERGHVQARRYNPALVGRRYAALYDRLLTPIKKRQTLSVR